MKQGKSLTELAQELSRINETARDYSVPVGKLSMTTTGEMEFAVGTGYQQFELNTWSAGQVANYADIPKQYFDRIRQENSLLLSRNVNHALTKIAKTTVKPESRMVRTLDGKVRAFLSSRYRRLDAFDLLNETLPLLLGHDFQAVSSEITDRRLYLKATTARIEGEVKAGDVVQYGVMISTSDVGAGALRIEPFLNRLVCLNGMVMSSAFRKFHIGKNLADLEIQELTSNATKALDDQAFFSTVRDILTATMDPSNFEREVNKLREAADRKILNFDLEKVVELAMNVTGVKGDVTKQNILTALSDGNEGAGLTQWGLANSFTRAAQSSAVDYDTATDIERAGGEIVSLNGREWKRIAEIA